jgi:hypothetical protein
MWVARGNWWSVVKLEAWFLVDGKVTMSTSLLSARLYYSLLHNANHIFFNLSNHTHATRLYPVLFCAHVLIGGT